MYNAIKSQLPLDWEIRFEENPQDSVRTVELSQDSALFRQLNSKVMGTFNLGVRKIDRVENPYLYAQYLLRKEQYECSGSVREELLFHDTSALNIPSIIETNLDWRRAFRVKYGKGVSFSPSPAYANRESSRSNGTHRAFVMAKVLVQNIQTVNSTVALPSIGYDTTMGNCNNVYVKYYDDEFYPLYIIYYTNRDCVYRRRY